MKKILLFIAAALMATIMTHAAIVESGNCGASVTYELDDQGVLTISGTGKMSNYDEMGNYSPFFRENDIYKVVINEGVTSIGEDAFNFCSNLTEITIPNSVTAIGGAAFYYCSNLTEITIPNGVTSIGGAAFEGCRINTIHCETAITPAALNASLDLPPDAILVFIPEGTKTAYQNAWGNGYTYFDKTVELTVNVTTPGTLAQKIGEQNYRPVEVNKLTVTGSLNDADFDLMKNTMTLLYDIDLSEVTNRTMPVSAFEGKKILRKIALPNGLTEVSERAFYDTGLNEITIPNSINQIGSYAFGDSDYYKDGTISFISKVNITDLSAWCKIVFYDNYSNPLYNGAKLYLKGAVINDLVIPEEFTEIKNYSFSGGLFQSVTFHNNVKSVGLEAFRCGTLNKVYIKDLISWCNIQWGANNKYSSNPLNYAHNLYLNNKKIEKLEVPEGVTELKYGAFEGGNFKSAVLPKSVLSISKRAFANCDSLIAITLNEKIETVSSDAFKNCTALDTITCMNVNAPDVLGYKQDEWGNTTNNYGPTNFATIDPKKCVLRVPTISKIIYGLHPIWGQFVTMENFDVPGTYYKLNVEADAQFGTVNGGNKLYKKNEKGVIEAIAKDGYKFKQWNDGNSENPRTVTMTKDETFIAEFVVDPEPTSVEENVINNAAIYTNNGMLFVEGAEDDYRVFDTTGRIVYSGREKAIELPKGIYMVKIGEKVQKVIL